jgi:hypothetical protein
MSYGLDLVQLPSGVDRNEAYKKILQREESLGGSIRDRLGPIDSSKEEKKQRLARALITCRPTLKMFKRDYARIAKTRSISESEARRLFRNVELNEEQLSIQIVLFDDGAGVYFSFNELHGCRQALQVLWDCLEILESEGGLSTFDPQIDRVLDLSTDFETVLECVCGIDRDK